jgi:hypothetical protein
MAEIIDTPDATITKDTRQSGDGKATVVTYSVEPKANTTLANELDIRSKAQQAITANNVFLNIQSPTNAQVLTQVQRLTRENTAIIKFLFGLLDDTTGT